MHHFQTPFNVPLILEQVSNCDDLLREQMSTEKASCVRQHGVISDKNVFVSKLCATANGHAPKGLDDRITDKDSKVANDDIWMQPKHCMPATCFFQNT